MRLPRSIDFSSWSSIGFISWARLSASFFTSPFFIPDFIILVDMGSCIRICFLPALGTSAVRDASAARMAEERQASKSAPEIVMGFCNNMYISRRIYGSAELTLIRIILFWIFVTVST